MTHFFMAIYHGLWMIAPFFIRKYLKKRGAKSPAYLDNWSERMGGFYAEAWQDVIWIHAVSVGETRAALPIVESLKKRLPESRFLITQTTPTGRAIAQSLFPYAQCRYLPYDKYAYVCQFLNQHRPRLAIFMETEIWPNFISECHRRKIPIFLINARLSEKSLKGYMKIRFLIKPIIAKLSGILAQTIDDKQRFQQLNAQNLWVCGNSKYDLNIPESMLQLAKVFKERIGSRPVVVCASTRKLNDIDEAALLLRAWKKYRSDSLLIIIPRHPERFQEAFDCALNLGFICQYRSDDKAISADTQVWIGDSMGELMAYYLTADVAFVGGSLVDTGCQNIIEPITCGLPTLYGYSTYNFNDVCQNAVQSGAALQVFCAEEWAENTQFLLDNPQKRKEMSMNAAQLIKNHQGASQKMADILYNHLIDKNNH